MERGTGDGAHLVLAFLGSDVQRAVHVLGGGVDVGSVLEQQHDDVDVAQPGGDVQRRLLFLCGSIALASADRTKEPAVNFKDAVGAAVRTRARASTWAPFLSRIRTMSV